MKVILLEEVKGQGGEGDVIDVARGYAENFLLPQKKAVHATKGNLKQLEARKHNIQKRESQRLDTADKLVEALNEKSVTIKAKVGEEGQLFGSVTTTQIAAAIAEQIGADIDRKKIDLHTAIKTAGEHTATISIYRDVKAVLTIVVADEKAANEPVAEVIAEDAIDVSAANDVAEEELGNTDTNADANTDKTEDFATAPEPETEEPAEAVDDIDANPAEATESTEATDEQEQ
ncbi:MAG: 50S ribosomal protein L9 [Coriobacteriales bacterium]|jgi:large subunit ribosomal protein L9|nr:50S ribosomal protein L9 [Coriobacteriales bacterium]